LKVIRVIAWATFAEHSISKSKTDTGPWEMRKRQASCFTRLLEHDRQNHIESMLKKGSGDSYLPMNLSSNDLEKMPNTPGVYYFHDNKGKIIYVGKAKRLKKRVTSHFSNNDVSKKKQDLIRMVSKISFRECGNELMMGVFESIEIKRLWPSFNKVAEKI